MPSTTNTQTVAPPSGLLAMSLVPGMATNTAAEVAWLEYREPRKVVRIIEHWGTSPGEQDTSNTVCEACHWPYKHTGVGFVLLTHAGIVSAPGGFRARDAIFELKRLSGLTWEELATLLSVTRRSLHLWANGTAINTVNEKRLRNVLVTIRELDRGTASENRALLLAPVRDGDITVGDLLQGEHFRDALTLVGRGRGRALPPVTRAGAPGPEKLSVADMLGTSGDRIHTDEGRALPRRRGPRRGG